MARRSLKVCYLCGAPAVDTVYIPPTTGKRKGDRSGRMGVCARHATAEPTIIKPSNGCKHRWVKVGMGYDDEGDFDLYECTYCFKKENRRI